MLKTKRALLYYYFRVYIYCNIKVAETYLVLPWCSTHFIYGLFYSVWHVGIENQLLPGPAGCSSGLNTTNNILSLKEQILAKPVINCEDIAWSILGLSAATINSLLLFLIFILNAIYLWGNYGTKKEKNN